MISKPIATMKNLFKNLMLVAVVAMAFTACTEEQNEVNATKKGSTLTFTADFTNETRTALTDDNDDGVYNAAWEAGDIVIFAAYNGDTLLQVSDAIYIEEEDITNDGASVTLTATFEDVVEAGTTIKGYVNYYYDEYWKTFVSNVNTNWQEAIPGRVKNLNASSEAIVWGGGENTPIMFKHDSAYGLMTIEAPEGAKINYVELSLADFDGNTQNLRLADGDMDANNVFMFCCEPMDVKTFTLVAEDENYEQYNYGKEFEQGTFAFTKGRISKYTINKWYTKLEAPQNVTAELDGTGDNVVFTWEAVENASAYAIYVDDTYVKDVNTETLTYTVSLNGRAPFSSVKFEVAAKGTDLYMDSSTSSASFTVPISKDAEGEEGFDFEYNKVEKLGENWYKFSSTEHSYYMTLSFNGDNIENITAGESKVYSTNDGTLDGWNNSGSNESLFTCQYEQSGYEGWFFQGENTVFVDRLENNDFQITAFCKRGIYVDYDPWTIYPLFKGSWNGTFEAEEHETLATPEINATVDGNTITVQWDPVLDATGYIVTINGVDNTTSTNSYTQSGFAAGEYTIEVVATAAGYTNSAAATKTVEVVEQGVVEPEVVEFTSVTVEAADSNLNYHNLTFTDGTYTAVIKLCTRGTTEYVAGNYNQDGSFGDESTLYIGGYVYENTWNGADCWPVTMEVIDNGDDTATFNLVCNEYPSAVQHKGTYTGVLDGLTLVKPGSGEEVVLPEFVIPGEGGAYTYDFRYTKLVDGLDANNAIRVAQDNGWIWDIKFNPGLSSIVPGDYTAVQSFTTADALEVDTYQGSVQYDNGYTFFYADSFSEVSINVQKEGEFYCITLIGANGYSAVGKTYRLVYIGKIEK